MGSCRIQNIKPPCGYNVEGIARIWLLDFDDFGSFRFEGNGLYDNCYVTSILRQADFTEIDAPDTVAEYTSSGTYVHTIKTFIGTLSASTLANLHLATKRRQIVLFKANSGQFYTFGYDAGATVAYTNQTAEGFGSTVTITANSIYPLFEASETVLTENIQPGGAWSVDFDNSYCIDDGE